MTRCFCRPAKEKDFKKQAERFKKEIPSDLREKIDATLLDANLSIHPVRRVLKMRRCISYQEAETLCNEYKAYIHALRDFKHGRDVFVTY